VTLTQINIEPIIGSVSNCRLELVTLDDIMIKPSFNAHTYACRSNLNLPLVELVFQTDSVRMTVCCADNSLVDACR